MSCNLCYSTLLHFDLKNSHTCIPATCSNCFSPKDLFDRLCRKCMTSTPCFFCTCPSAYDYQGVNVCPTHLSMSCQLEIDMRKQDRKDFNDDYEKQMEMQRLRREHNHEKLRRIKNKSIKKKRAKKAVATIKDLLDRRFRHATFAV